MRIANYPFHAARDSERAVVRASSRTRVLGAETRTGCSIADAVSTPITASVTSDRRSAGTDVFFLHDARRTGGRIDMAPGESMRPLQGRNRRGGKSRRISVARSGPKAHSFAPPRRSPGEGDSHRFVPGGPTGQPFSGRTAGPLARGTVVLVRFARTAALGWANAAPSGQNRRGGPTRAKGVQSCSAGQMRYERAWVLGLGS